MGNFFSAEMGGGALDIKERYTARARRLAVVSALLAVFVMPRAAVTRIDAPEHCITPNKRITMYAEEIGRSPDGRPKLAYGLTPDSASSPGPTIQLLEGDCIAITVVNDIPEQTLHEMRDDPLYGSRDHHQPLAVSLHVHGVKYTQSSDGTMDTDSIVPPGRARTYIWYAAPRVTVGARVASLGTAGYWWYHDHIIGTHHGTGGAATGLFGAVIVRRAGDVLPDRTYVVGMGVNATLNLKKFPETDCVDLQNPVPSNSCYIARQGERVEFAVIGFGDDFHTFHLHGHTWANNRTGMLQHQAEETQVIDVRSVGPSETFGFQVIAGEEVGPGRWMLHCHVQAHSDRGMTTFFNVLPPAESIPAGPLPA